MRLENVQLLSQQSEGNLADGAILGQDIGVAVELLGLGGLNDAVAVCSVGADANGAALDAQDAAGVLGVCSFDVAAETEVSNVGLAVAGGHDVSPGNFTVGAFPGNGNIHLLAFDQIAGLCLGENQIVAGNTANAQQGSIEVLLGAQAAQDALFAIGAILEHNTVTAGLSEVLAVERTLTICVQAAA